MIGGREAKLDPFLDRLIGSWDLHGSMGSTPLHQTVEGSWVLGGLFVELRFREVDGQPYEAVYYIGHNQDKDLYVLHLLDSTGVYPAATDTVGIGRRDGDAIPFVFGNETAPFTNRFEWREADAAWTFHLTQLEDGELRTFATKRMTRRKVRGRIRVRMEAPVVRRDAHAALPLQAFSEAALPAIAELMYVSYYGTIDGEGETQDGVSRAVAEFAAGKYGPALLDCSFAAWDGERPVSGVLVSEENGMPLFAYTFTHPEWRGRGLMTAVMQTSMNALGDRGYGHAKLRVTVGNMPAVRVYEKLGFHQVPG